jgi:death on curing protein
LLAEGNTPNGCATDQKHFRRRRNDRQCARLPHRPGGPLPALARPCRTRSLEAVYPDLDAKAAALLHSVARNHALVDGNKRLALAAVIAFYGLNGRRLTLTNDQAYDLVINVAAGQLDHADAIADILRNATQPRR